ncbi:MAG: SPFH domain-containing protein [Oscillospiraceae bacterium]|nr:SPFH domain-containing protein [Oscillospiraceae bacterium]
MYNLAIIIIVIVIVFFAALITILSRYKKCPSDKILVVYGKLGQDKQGAERSSICLHGGAIFIMPVFQSYQFLDLTPLSISVDLKSALSRQNIRVDVPSRFTVGISTEPGIMQNAAERLLGLPLNEVQELAKDIIFGQLRLVIATMDIEEINMDRDKFLEAVSGNVETELKKIGLRLINVNVTDISDESGYIQALGKEAAAKAINDAKRMVALQEKEGSIGEADAKRDQRISVSMADSDAIKGENDAKMNIAKSNADRREKEAEALKRATAAENVQKALADQESFNAQRDAEITRAGYEKARQEAEIVVKANVEKQRVEIQAEAEAEQARRRAMGESDAIFARMSAEARGNQEILTKQAEGFAKIVEAAGGDVKAAIQLMIAEKIDELVKIQVEAIKNLKIDKVTVWDSMGGDGKSPATANFLSGMLKSVPPLNEMFKMAGMEIPQYLGSNIESGESVETNEANQANQEKIAAAVSDVKSVKK